MEYNTLSIENLKQKKTKISIFPINYLNLSDYLIGSFFFLFCYFFLVHSDLYLIGWCSLNFLFGHPLDFYENCKNFLTGGYAIAASYPPSTYASFALWLYPFKVIGLIKSPAFLSPFLVYWLKALTSIIYIISGFIFYKITEIYSKNNEWRKFTTWLWLTSPLAIFSQIIFSQCDIFYLFFTLGGFLCFLKNRIYLASFVFSIGVTFKYFPIFVFLPLLFFFEKNIIKIIISMIIFIIPTFLIKILFKNSPAYVEGVLNFFALPRIFSASLNHGDVKIYCLFLMFAVLLGICYALNNKNESSLQIAAYIFLVASILPFLVMLCHPGWVIFLTPAIVLTTMLQRKDKIKSLLHLDLFGIVVFIIYIFIFFQDSVDSAMFQTNIFHIPFNNHYKIASLITSWQNTIKNTSIYFSGFAAYLMLQIILKYPNSKVKFLDIGMYFYRVIRIRYYFSILIFIVPTIFAVYKSHLPKYANALTNNNAYCVASLRNQKVGEKFIARCPIFNIVVQFLSIDKI